MGALTQLGSLCRLLRILDVCKMRHRFANILWYACLNHPTISSRTRITIIWIQSDVSVNVMV